MAFQDLSKEMTGHAPGLQHVNKTGKELITKSSSGERREQLQKDLDSLNNQWTAVSTMLEQRQAKLEKAISNLKQFRVSSSIEFFPFKWTHC